MRILIIDDHAIIEEGIIKRVKAVFPKASCYFTTNIRNALAEVNNTQIDLIISDLEFNNNPKIDGFYLVKNIKDLEPRIKTIAYTNYNSYRIMKKAKNAGFNSFLDKGCSLKDFSNTLRNVIRLGDFESGTMKQLLKKKDLFLRTVFTDSLYGLSELSKRELELLKLSIKTTNRLELANIMNISAHTVDSHFKNILTKLRLKYRKELTLFAKEFKNEILKIA